MVYFDENEKGENGGIMYNNKITMFIFFIKEFTCFNTTKMTKKNNCNDNFFFILLSNFYN